MRKLTLLQLFLRLLFLLGLSFSLISCNQPAPPPQHTLDPVKTWIKQHAIPFNTAEPGASNNDLQPLKQLVGDASIVGLGEETHGTHEFFAMKQRIFEFLVLTMDFRVFALENSWDSSRLIDTYITTGVGDPRALIMNDMYPTWDRQEFFNLISWMRAYNADPAHPTKIHFAGFDCTSVTPAAFSNVLAYVKIVDPSQATHIQTLYAGLDMYGGELAFIKVDQATFGQYRDKAQQVYAFLQAHQAAYIMHSSQQAFDLVLQTARVIVQYATLEAMGGITENPAAFSLRDKFMAENAIWLYDHEGGNIKMVLSAHDVHIANDPSYSVGSPHQKSMGNYLGEHFKATYLPIGMSFYSGSFLSYYHNISLASFTVGMPPATTYNYTLGSVGIEQYILDLRNIPAGPVSDWVRGPRPFRLIAQFYDPTKASDFYYTGSLQQWFDIIINFQNVTAAQYLS